MKKKLQAGHIADFLESELLGPDIAITGVCSLDVIKPHCLMFVELSTPHTWTRISDLKDNLVLCDSEMAMSINGPRIATPNPRLSFIKVVRKFIQPEERAGIDPSAHIHPAARIGAKVSVGAFSIIGKDVVVGDHTVIRNHVVISGRTTVGRHCHFKSNSVIGEDGFGFCLDENKTPHAQPHFGGVTIGDYVWMGANSTVERGIFDDTVIEDHVKIDDLVQVGHNSVVGQGSRVAAGSILCGGVRIGENCWVAPNSNILERTVIGKDSFIGLGTNVLRDVPPNSVVVGNPARKIRDNNKVIRGLN